MGVTTILLLVVPPAQGAQITNSFAKIFVDGVNAFNARSYNDYINFIAGSGIDLTTGPNSITISSTISPGSDTNTAQIGDAGTHHSVFGSRFNATKNLLKTFTCSGSAVCSSNTTDVNISVTATGSTLKIDTISQQSDRFLQGLDNATGDWSYKIFSVDNQTANRDIQITGINNITGTITTNQFSINNVTCNGNQFLKQLNNSTGFTVCATPATSGGSGYTKLNNLDGGNAKILATNTTSSNTQATLKTLTAGSGISITNGSKTITIATTSSGGPVSLSGNLTSSSTVAWTTIFTIPLTANSGNAIDGLLVASTNTAGAAVQVGSRLSSAAQGQGWCNYVTPTTATATVIDNLVLTATTHDTGETVWLPAINTPQGIQFRCVVNAGSSPPNLLVEFQAEAASTVKIAAGSYYIKTP